MIFELFGLLASLAFGVMAIPQIVHILKAKNANGTSWGFILLNYIGNILSFAYILKTDLDSNYFHIPLYINYAMAVTNLIILTFLKFWFKS